MLLMDDTADDVVVEACLRMFLVLLRKKEDVVLFVDVESLELVRGISSAKEVGVWLELGLELVSGAVAVVGVLKRSTTESDWVEVKVEVGVSVVVTVLVVVVLPRSIISVAVLVVRVVSDGEWLPLVLIVASLKSKSRRSVADVVLFVLVSPAKVSSGIIFLTFAVSGEKTQRLRVKTAVENFRRHCDGSSEERYSIGFRRSI